MKTSLAPGSRVVTDYLDKAGSTESLGKLGFHTVGYGCTTCIGNSGPLPDPVAKAVTDGDLVAAAVLSGNRNFEGRINPLVKANYLASPPLVVAYALAGTTNFDLTNEPLGKDTAGRGRIPAGHLAHERGSATNHRTSIQPEMFKRATREYSPPTAWNAIDVTDGDLYDWDENSTYIHEPPFLADHHAGDLRPADCAVHECWPCVGDSVTTDHISPAGNISKNSPAGKYLIEHGVQPADFNSYGSRRGDDRVMLRGTFANIRIRNISQGAPKAA